MALLTLDSQVQAFLQQSHGSVIDGVQDLSGTLHDVLDPSTAQPIAKVHFAYARTKPSEMGAGAVSGPLTAKKFCSISPPWSDNTPKLWPSWSP